MSQRKGVNSIILVGMPGVGKSTLGRRLAQIKHTEFVDTDHLIETDVGQPLQSVLDKQGYLVLRQEEEKAILARTFSSCVVATGGSVVYSHKTMSHLKQFGLVVYLRDTLDSLVARIDNFDSRGIACKPGQSFASVFAERQILYRQYADVVVDIHGCSVETSLKRLIDALT